MRNQATLTEIIGSNPRRTQNTELYPTLELHVEDERKRKGTKEGGEKNHQEKSGGGDKNLMVENKQNEEIKGKEIEADNSASSIQISEGVEGKSSTNESDCKREKRKRRKQGQRDAEITEIKKQFWRVESYIYIMTTERGGQ